jgi:TRAP-type C4-dicarboxylate transport system permease small subunit
MKTALRVLVALGMLALFFFFANLSLYHSWAASLSDWHHQSELKEWHVYWAGYFSDLALFALLTSGAYVGVSLIRRWRARLRPRRD